MLTKNDVKIIKNIVNDAISGAVAPLVTREEAKSFATKDDLKGFATKDDLKGFATKDDLKGFATKDDLKGLTTKVDSLASTVATKADVANLDTKLTRLDVKMSRQFAEFKAKTTKDRVKLERAIKSEHRIGNTDFGHLESEDRKIVVRVEKIERHLGFAPAA